MGWDGLSRLKARTHQKAPFEGPQYKKEKSFLYSIEIFEGAGHHRLRADEYPFFFKELKRAFKSVID